MRKILVTFLAVLAISDIKTFADDFPQLPVAPEITRGILSNGISYYLVSNSHTPSFADFALVQENFSDIGQARRNLVSLTHFGDRRPTDFLSFHGVPCPKDGFVRTVGGSTFYRFPRVPVRTQAVCDSTILMLLDISSTCPGNQAIIISGDIDVSGVKERLNLLSLAISQRDNTGPAEKYEWIPSNSISVYYSGSPAEDLSTLSITYASPRTPLSRMNTTQALVVRQYAVYLGTILEKRIRSAFRSEGIPLASIRYRHKESSEGKGDELYSLVVSVSSRDFRESVGIVAAILSDIDNRGVTSGELEDAKRAMVMAASREEGNRWLTNAEYVSRCSRSFLFGASLASEEVVNDVFAGSSLPIESELPIFNIFASALLGPGNNLTLGFEIPGAVETPELQKIFSDSWKVAETDLSTVPAIPGRCRQIDLSVVKNKAKIVEKQDDAMTGGTFMKISNGLRVICKKTELKGEFKYAFLVRGVSPLVSGLSPGQLPFLTDIFNLCEVSGMRGDEFREMLASEGISFSPELTLSDLRITGSAPKSKIPVLLKALNMLSTVSNIPDGEYRYYKSCEALRIRMRRHSVSGPGDVVDSLLNIGGGLPQVKYARFLTDDLPAYAEGYIVGQFGRFSSGVLVMMGDIDVEQIEKPICQYLGGIPEPVAVIGRNKIMITSFGGEYAEVGESCTNSSSHLAWRFSSVFNEVNQKAMRLAMIALEKALPGALTPLGYSFSLEQRTVFYPQEQETIYINCFPCPMSGLPEGTSVAPPDVVAETLDIVISQLSSAALDVKALEGVLSSSVAVELKDTEKLVDAVLTRYSAGKNTLSGMSKSALNVSLEQIQSVFKSMQSGRRVKYLIHETRVWNNNTDR